MSPRRSRVLPIVPHSVVAVLCAIAVGVAPSCRRDNGDATGVAIRALALGLTFLDRDQLAEADSQFRRVIASAPGEPVGYANLGLTKLRAGKYDEAEQAFGRALALDPTDVAVRLMMAKLHEVTGRPAEARAELERLTASAVNPKALYALATLAAEAADTAAPRRRLAHLKQLAQALPANVVVRMELIDALVEAGAADEAVQQLEELRRLPPEPPAQAIAVYGPTVRLLRLSKVADARAPLRRFRRLLEGTPAYQVALLSVAGPPGPLIGVPRLTFSPAFASAGSPAASEAAIRDAIRFVDAPAAGLACTGRAVATSTASAAPMVLATGDYDGDGSDDAFISVRIDGGRRRVSCLLRAASGAFIDAKAAAGVSLPAEAVAAAFADYDNDGRLDLYVADAAGHGHLYRNTDGRTFSEVGGAAGLSDAKLARKAVFVDIDHDGDLDLLLATDGGNRVNRNNGDGTFTEMSASYGLAGGGRASTDLVFADFDDDGRVDLFMVNGNGSSQLFRNSSDHRFEDITAKAGIETRGGTAAAAAGDYDNDGFPDLLVIGRDGVPALFRNSGDGTFSRDRRSLAALDEIRSLDACGTAFVDYDNDGLLDVVVAGAPHMSSGRGLLLFRNAGQGRFENRSSLLAAGPRSVAAIATTDVGPDGDTDLLVTASDGTVHLLRNEGGNVNHFITVRLTGLRTGSGKNNDFGIGARLEVRAGDLYQSRVVTSGVTLIGIGRHFKAEVLRIEWPNGVPQTIYFPGTEQDVLERELLKGSCAFVYAWDGTRFTFVTDLMWRSALGMPLGIMGGGGSAYAPAAASREYIKLPTGVLKPVDGRYRIQLTEELWETAYVDQLRLVVFDHPDSVTMQLNERFVPPNGDEATLRPFLLTRLRAPTSASDGDGTDVLPALRARDDRYVSNLTTTAFQGVTEPHDLILDLGGAPLSGKTILLLDGWVYPTDASINLAVSQSARQTVAAPSLDVRGADGRWQTAIADLGFPAGKQKTVLADLTRVFPTADRHVRIRTNMQIYWDQALVGAESPASPSRVTTLSPTDATLRSRGFSRTYRKGGRYGPHWFDYDSVATDAPWRPIIGDLTRFGDVEPLLRGSDDQYVVMAPGDAMSVDFDANLAPPLRAGWTRDFLIYSDGWIKDADLNTAFGGTIAPLPFHGMSQYPYGAGERYLADSARRRYRSEYMTRSVGPRRTPLPNTRVR